MSRHEGIRRQDFLNDLRSGLTDRELMEKYMLTPRGMGTLFRNLVNADLISFSELLRRSGSQLNLPELIAEFRIRSRKQLEFLIPISDYHNPENTGLVYDISDDGVGARGLRVKAHELKTFIIPTDDYFRADPIIFQGLCRWVDEKDDRWESAAGFKVVKVTRGSLKGLQEIIRNLNPADR